MSEPSPYQSLYRRYRPRRFSEIRGQQHLVAALQNAVREDRVGHAYLLSGPRGTGKTTSARILAKVLNCEHVVDGEPCLDCESCRSIEAGTSFDLHELDAASNNGVEAMRDLISKAGLGTPGRTKVYILDEVHQLSPAASAALLKTLEEPPGHVVFVLATTDPHKVLPTIRSRTQHFELHLIPADELDEHVRWVIKDAGLDAGEDEIAHVLREGGGSARDTLSALDRVVAAGGVDDRSVVIDDLLEALLERDAGAVLAAVHAAVSAGRDPRVLGESLIGRLRDAFLAAVGVALDHLPDVDRERTATLAVRVERPFLTRSLDTIGSALVEMRQAADPRITLETALVKLADVSADTSPAALLERIDRLERALAAGGGAVGPSAPTAPIAPTGAPAAPSAPAGTAPVAPAAPATASPSAAAGASRAADEARRKLAERAGGRPTPAPAPVPDRPAPAAEPATPPAAAPAAAGGAVDTIDVARAWTATVQPGLTGSARARYAAARLVGVEGSVVTFALPNDIHRQRCDDVRAEVEAALTASLGTAVSLRLVTDAAPAPSGGGAAGAGSPSAGPQDAEDEIDLDSLVDAPAEPVKSVADSLVEAFPGAELIEDDS